MNYRMIAYTLGWVMNIEGVCMLLPLICSLLYKDSCSALFLMCAGLCVVCGTLLCLRQPKKKTMYAKEGFVIVALSWIVISIFGAFPFYISGYIPNYVDALFETISGFTTTGASILTDVEVLPKSLLFWRSFTHWIGGMGVLVFLVAILPLSGGGDMHLIKAESPGPAVSKLVPKVKSSAKILYGIYIAFTALEVIFLLFGGMTLFEALTLSFGTAGTGGFGLLNSSIGEYSSYVQIVITVFMILFGIDFSIYYLILLRRFKTAVKSEELRAYLGIIALSVVLITINCRGLYESLFEAVRHSAFQGSSIITTTGFLTVDFDLWPAFSKTILVMLMFCGACAGSTGGGIKVSRVIILLKSICREIRIAARPRMTKKITMNGRVVEHETSRNISVFLAVYIALFFASLLIISIDNFGFTTNFTAVAAAFNNIGPGLAEVGPTQNFSLYSPLSTLVLAFDMLAGRLEIFPLLIMLSPYTWKK